MTGANPLYLGKPYHCAVCEEPRDAHDSPPTATPSGALICEDCGNCENSHRWRFDEESRSVNCRVCGIPDLLGRSALGEPTVPASRIMRERDQARLTILDLRELLAMAQTDRNRFEREKAEAQAALTVSRNTLDDLTDHCARQGAYIAKLQTEVAHLQQRNQYLDGEKQRLGHQSHKRLEIIENLLRNDAVGMDCTECHGTGWIGGEADVPDDYAGRTPAEEECPEAYETCFGGRAVR